jgi:hypothetical protein
MSVMIAVWTCSPRGSGCGYQMKLRWATEQGLLRVTRSYRNTSNPAYCRARTYAIDLGKSRQGAEALEPAVLRAVVASWAGMVSERELKTVQG